MAGALFKIVGTIKMIGGMIMLYRGGAVVEYAVGFVAFLLGVAIPLGTGLATVGYDGPSQRPILGFGTAALLCGGFTAHYFLTHPDYGVYLLTSFCGLIVSVMLLTPVPNRVVPDITRPFIVLITVVFAAYSMTPIDVFNVYYEHYVMAFIGAFMLVHGFTTFTEGHNNKFGQIFGSKAGFPTREYVQGLVSIAVIFALGSGVASSQPQL